MHAFNTAVDKTGFPLSTRPRVCVSIASDTIVSYMEAALSNPKSEMPRIDPLSSVPVPAPASIRARAACAKEMIDGPCTKRLSLRSASAGVGRRALTASPSPSLHDSSEGLPSAKTRRPQHGRVDSHCIKQEHVSPPTAVGTRYLTSYRQGKVFRPADARPRFSATPNPNRNPGSLASSEGSATCTARIDQPSYSHQTTSLVPCSSPQGAGDSTWLDPTSSSTPPRPSPSLSPFGSSPMAPPILAPIDPEGRDKAILIALNDNRPVSLPVVDSSSLERLRRSSPAKKRSRSKKNSLPSRNEASSSLLTKLELAQPNDYSILKNNSEVHPLEHPQTSPRGSLSPVPAKVEKVTIVHDLACGPSDPPVASKSTENPVFFQSERKSGGKNGRSQPPRPPNPWILYRSAQIQRLRTDPRFVKTSQCEVSKLISYMWRDETAEGRLKYERLAANAKAAHAIKYPDYTYRPAKKPRRKAEPNAEEATTPGSPDRASLTPINSELLDRTLTSPPTLQASYTCGCCAISNMLISQWATAGHPGEASWLPALPPTVESLDSSINHLLASLDYPLKSKNALELHDMSDKAHPLWSSTMNHSPDVGTNRPWGLSATLLPDLHLAPTVLFSAPAAFSAFDFGPVPSAFDEELPLWTAPLSPSFLASTPLSYHPSFESSSTASIASADDLGFTFSSPRTIASSVTSASDAPSSTNSTASPLWVDHHTPFPSASHIPEMSATSSFEKASTLPSPASPMWSVARFGANSDDILVDWD
ncbi:BQ2448_3154 [Microbotryum intermedium]|uniref:BQ2448_3154 protein n=1 Tax=Microbotryum intermedium TaxID=269621 RepID=A0A238FKH9_9BASI|nr:BQ2448_3154 [Microbotryum intermedium]